VLNNQQSKIYDLEERTAKFGEDIIEFAKKIPKNVITIPLIFIAIVKKSRSNKIESEINNKLVIKN